MMRNMVKMMSLAGLAGLGFAVQALDLNELVKEKDRTNQAIDARQPVATPGSASPKGPVIEVLTGKLAVDEMQKDLDAAMPAEGLKLGEKLAKDATPPAEDRLTTVKPVPIARNKVDKPGDKTADKPGDKTADKPGDKTADKPDAPPKKPAPGAALLGEAGSMPDEVKFSGDNLNVDAVTGLVTLEGNAKVWDKKTTTTADRMMLTLNADQKPEKIEAVGNVICIGKSLSGGKEVEVRASGGYSIYRASDQILTLTEKPRLITGRSYMEGMDKIIYDKAKNTFNTFGGKVVGGVMPDDFSQPKDASQPAAGDKKPEEKKPVPEPAKPL